MSAPIKVCRSHLRPRSFHWNCEADHIDYSTPPFGWAPSIAAAADAGRAHLAEHHAPTVGTYCRAHGQYRSVCGCIPAVIHATPERLAKVDMAPDYPNAALARLSGHTERSTGLFGDDFPCCATNQHTTPAERTLNHV